MIGDTGLSDVASTYMFKPFQYKTQRNCFKPKRVAPTLTVIIQANGKIDFFFKFVLVAACSLSG